MPSPKLGAVIQVLGRPFLITERESEYLMPEAEEHYAQYAGPSLDALLCTEDPAYGEQIGVAMAGDPGVRPSYVWCPDTRTLAHCPFHRLAVLRDGRLERR